MTMASSLNTPKYPETPPKQPTQHTPEAVNALKQEIESITPSKLARMNTAEFLQIDAMDRLQYINKGSIDAFDIISWEADTIEFTFTFDGKFNQALYQYVTAGQVLPDEVRTIKSGWDIYERIGLDGEFYSQQNGKRLIIKENTQIHITELAGPRHIQNIAAESKEKSQAFLDKNPQYNTAQYTDTVRAIFDKWLGEIEANIILAQSYEQAEDLNTTEASRLLTVTQYLKNAGLLDGLDHANNLIHDIKQIISILDRYASNLSYMVRDGSISFEQDAQWLPAGIESLPWLERMRHIALSQLGIHERTGQANKYFSEAGFGKLDARNVPWCAAFVNWVLQKSGYQGTDSLAAKSFIKWSGFGHVGIKLGDNILGWNQRNKVSLMPIRKQIVGYAIPTDSWLKIHQGVVPKDRVPDGAIIVYDRSRKNRQFA